MPGKFPGIELIPGKLIFGKFPCTEILSGKKFRARKLYPEFFPGTQLLPGIFFRVQNRYPAKFPDTNSLSGRNSGPNLPNPEFFPDVEKRKKFSTLKFGSNWDLIALILKLFKIECLYIWRFSD